MERTRVLFQNEHDHVDSLAYEIWRWNAHEWFSKIDMIMSMA